MFEGLTERLDGAFRRVRGQGRIKEPQIQAALRDVRSALLEADVSYPVVKTFMKAVKDRAVGAEVLKSLSPDQQLVKIVHEELVALLGGAQQEIDLGARPPVALLLVGLQGAGKTTTAAKLALTLKGRGREPLLVSTDVRRPAAMLQLAQLGERIGVRVFDAAGRTDPVGIARDAIRSAEIGIEDTVLVDTAGRLHVDEELMAELAELKRAAAPHEILFVADAMTGQDAVQVARSFDERLGLDGVVLTKLDGDARGGAALSIKSVTGKPIKLVGTGENLEALEPFHPDRMARRILGMGDVLSLVERAERAIDSDQAAELERKLRRAEFTIEDFYDQLQALKKMGSIESLAAMIPGFSKMTGGADLSGAEKELARVEAIIHSMTLKERRTPTILNASRRRRIARGSGMDVIQVNRFVKQYQNMCKLMKRMSRSPGRGFPKMGAGPFPLS